MYRLLYVDAFVKGIFKKRDRRASSMDSVPSVLTRGMSKRQGERCLCSHSPYVFLDIAAAVVASGLCAFPSSLLGSLFLQQLRHDMVDVSYNRKSEEFDIGVQGLLYQK